MNSRVIRGKNWYCPNCNYSNFEQNKKCKRCQEPYQQRKEVVYPQNVRGWFETVPDYGEKIPNTPFIPLKAPLVTSDFTIDSFLKDQKKKHKRDIHMIVNLSCSKDYYPKDSIPKEVSFYKLDIESRVSFIKN